MLIVFLETALLPMMYGDTGTTVALQIYSPLFIDRT